MVLCHCFLAAGSWINSLAESAITPTMGVSYEVCVPVTAVSGTSPTQDISIEESDDSGVNWFPVYHFERITAAGMYRSPQLRLVGNRLRYVRTIAGTTPSFTEAVNRLQSNAQSKLFRQFFDRALTPNGSTPTASYNVAGCSVFNIIVKMLAITTIAPVLKVMGSETNAAGDWYQIGSDITDLAASATKGYSLAGYLPKFIRVEVKTAGVGATLDYIKITGEAS